MANDQTVSVELVNQVEELILTSRTLEHAYKKELLGKLKDLPGETLTALKAIFEDEAREFTRINELERTAWRTFRANLTAIVDKAKTH